MIIEIIDESDLELEFSERKISSALQKLNELSTEIDLVEVCLDCDTKLSCEYSAWIKVHINNLVIVREGRDECVETSVDLAIKKLLQQDKVNI